jgi:PKD repeat protein
MINFTPMKIRIVILISFFLLFCFTSITASPLKVYCTGPDTAGIIKGKDNVCFGTIETYTVPSIAFATGYSWKLPTGVSIVSGANTNSITVLFNGISGNITVEGTNSCSTGVASIFFVKVNPIPKATIIIDNPSGCVPHTVNFILQNITNADSLIAKFLWTFDESNEATTKNATYTYGISDFYNVNLKITSELGCNTTFGPISINAYPIPKADFISSPNNTALASFPLFKFKDKSTTSELILKSKIVKYEWDFGDLNLDEDTSSKRNPEFLYLNVM